MKLKLLAAVVALCASVSAQALTVVNFFGKSGTTNKFKVTESSGTTYIGMTNVGIFYGGSDFSLDNGYAFEVGDSMGTLSLNVSSIAGSLTGTAGSYSEEFSGTYSIVNDSGDLIVGGNIVKGILSEAAGAVSFSVATNNGATLEMNSAVIPASYLDLARLLNFSMSNVSTGDLVTAPGGTTIAAFTASYSGTASSHLTVIAADTSVPEPAPLALLGLAGLGLVASRRWKA